jgi:rod shape-determining protein MreC
MTRAGVIALTVFIIVVGLLFSLSPRTQQRLSAAVLQAIAPIFSTGSSVKTRVQAYTTGVKSLGELEEENKRLKTDNNELRVTNQMLRDLGEENASLRRALGFKERAGFKLIPARVIARESSTWWSQVQIDRGEADGVETDMPVLTEAGLVGKTTTVARHTAYVLLIADENCKVAVSIEGSREQGILSGTRVSTAAQPDLVIRFLPKTVDAKPGQKVYSSGVSGGVFPSGLVLGSVAEEPRVRELDAQIRVAPAVDMSRLENLFVVIPHREGGG